MPTTMALGRPAVPQLTRLERELLRAVGCGLADQEIARALALSESGVDVHLRGILTKLGLRDRAAAIVHAFDSGLVVPGRGPRVPVLPVRRLAVRERPVRISLLGPLRAWRGGQPVDLGHLRQQAVLARLALCRDRTVSKDELLDGIWGMEPPLTKVVPVYIYRLRKVLQAEDGTDSVIRHDRCGYRLVPGAVEVDVTRMEELAGAAAAAERSGELAEAAGVCAQALDLFRGEPLAGLPGPFAELERLRLTEHRTGLTLRKLDLQLRLGRHSEAVGELSALAAARPLDEPVGAMLMRALCLSGRQADALRVFERTRRRLADELGVAPSRLLRRTHRTIMLGGDGGLSPAAP
ncbi:BTAD domain-containing putative transcriptional regulator [Streptomyces sp. NPDC058961]|uniref:BTAD domain-containing putative transcriptional regulator n=1 Tax=Streptomyces TaxID=1883 RepID=UPI000C270A8B|nr:BTAD domain-containing putative transcriptional regulator [Streptomyces sp. CB01201]MBX7466709.1 LuxR C-terminal-related transcriptional regulator [Streptomyces sp. MAG02]PJM98700.1 transcriptional regulator [Streptomyces sp. CB01201]